MEKTTKTKAALYARVSTGKQAEKDLSIPDQIKQMEEYCQSQGWLYWHGNSMCAEADMRANLSRL